MSKEDKDKIAYKDEGGTINLSAILILLRSNLKWFILSIVILVSLTAFYLKYAQEHYNVHATVLIKDEEKGGASDEQKVLEGLGVSNLYKNIDNEIEILKSRDLSEAAIYNLGLYTTYHIKGKFMTNDYYDKTPFVAYMLKKDLMNLEKPISLTATSVEDSTFSINYTNQVGENSSIEVSSFPQALETPDGTVMLYTNTLEKIEEGEVLEVNIYPPLKIASNYSSRLSIEPISKTTSIAHISFNATSIIRGEEFVDKLIEMYNIDAANDKIEIAKKTGEFLKDRIKILAKEVNRADDTIKNYKRSKALLNLTTHEKLVVEGYAVYEKEQIENEGRISLMTYLLDYITDPHHDGEMIPTNVAQTGILLSELINQYNLELRNKKRLLATATKNNPLVLISKKRTDVLRNDIERNVTKLLRSLYLKRADLAISADKAMNVIKDTPLQEKTLMSMERQRETKVSLFLMLLKKQEENAINIAATTDHAKVIDHAIASGPVSPKKGLMLMFAIILGTALPAIVLIVSEMLKYKIEVQADIEKLTRIPVVLNLPMFKKLNKNEKWNISLNEIPVLKDIFRALRTQISDFTTTKKTNTILLTSTASDEGKTFIAKNLAASYSTLDKLVLLVDLNIREYDLNKKKHSIKENNGLTHYLTVKNSSLDSIIKTDENYPNLHFISVGKDIDNFNELLHSERFENFMEEVRNRYEFIILDSSPMGFTSEPLIIAKYAQVTLFVCRSNFTTKKDIEMLNEAASKKRLNRPMIILNAININKKKNKYFYGYTQYGQRFVYSKRYAYGYTLTGNGYHYGRCDSKIRDFFYTIFRGATNPFKKKANKK